METKIDIVEILKDKPKGTKLYADAFGVLSIEEICVEDKDFGITLLGGDGDELYFYNNGKYDIHGEPILVPSKDMQDWSKFAWKKGDVLVSKDNVYIIFEEFEDDAYTRFKGKHYLWKECDEEDYNKEETKMLTSVFEKANDDAAQTYINTIEKRLCGKLNLETLEIEKDQSEFKDGDIVTITFNWGEDIVYIFKSENSNSYSYYAWLNGSIPTIIESSHPKSDIYTVRLSTETEKQQLFNALAKEGKAWDAEKKQIVDLKQKVDELKPFDKVLVRDGKNEIWEPAFFFRNLSHLNVYNYQTVGGESRVYCIPFNEETAKLIGTTDDWEG